MADGWVQWSKHVLKELERLDKNMNKISGNITDIKVDIGKLKVKSGIWGAVGACIPISIGVIVYLIKAYTTSP